MIVAQSLHSPQLVALIECTFLEPKPNSVAAVNYKLLVDRDTQIWHDKVVNWHNSKMLK